MSKKHFIELADCLRRTKPSEQDILMQSGEYGQWKRDVEAIARVCISFNDRFDYPRFMDWINK